MTPRAVSTGHEAATTGDGELNRVRETQQTRRATEPPDGRPTYIHPQERPITEEHNIEG